MPKLSVLSLAILSILSTQIHAESAPQTSPANASSTTAADPVVAPTSDSAQQTEPTEVVIVTGTRAKNRTANQSLQPIDVISGDVLRDSGTTELGAALAKLIPSIEFPRPAVVDGAELARPAVLRGLSPDQVLVLINGKRLHTSAFINLDGTLGRGSSPADFNSIPISAVQRIEVLRDGAAARYGSDAIAGVINIILKGGPSGGSVTTEVGKYNKGDGTQRNISANSGFSLGSAGWLNVSAEASKNGYTNRAGPDLQVAAPFTTYGQIDSRFGDPATKLGKILINGQYDITDQIQLYGFGIYSKNKGQSAELYRISSSSNNILALYPNGYLPLTNNVNQDATLVAGLRGTILDGWHYDASVNYGRNEYEVNIDTINPSLYRATGSTPFSFYDGALTNQQTLVNLDFSKSLNLSWLPHPLSTSFGLEYKNQDYHIGAGEPLSYYGSGASGQAGYTPQDAGSHTRSSYAGYVDFETKLTNQLTTSLAVRNENYDDFGDRTSAALSGRFDFTPQVAIRGSISNGFRAPSLPQEYFSQTSSQLINGVLQNSGTFATNTVVAKLFGAEDLKPETSRNYSLGLVLNPVDRLFVTLDAYLVDINNRITLSSAINTNTPAVAAYLAKNGITNVNYSSVRYFTNAADTRTKGADLVVSYRAQLESGLKWTPTLGINFNQNEVTKVAANPQILNNLQLISGPISGTNFVRLDRRETLGLMNESNPELKITLGNDFSLGNWTLHTNLVRYGSFTSISNNGPTQDQKFGAQWVLDLGFDYRYQNWTFSLGSDNVGNTYPDRGLYATQGGTVPYSQFSPNGFNGAFYYGKVAYKW